MTVVINDIFFYNGLFKSLTDLLIQNLVIFKAECFICYLQNKKIKKTMFLVYKHNVDSLDPDCRSHMCLLELISHL